MQKIGRYEVEYELGRGGMAEVFLAYDPYTKRQVAIKVLLNFLADDERVQIFFHREAEVIAALEHPCIVPIFDFGFHENDPYFVMRYMAGGTLRERMDAQELRPTLITRIVERVAAGLDAAHAKGIIHRDVKPANIMFDQERLAYLSDFGIAKLRRRSDDTTDAMVVGTPIYMSPEQIQNNDVDGRCDVYALGVILFQILAGRPPFQGETPTLTAAAHVMEPIPRLSEIRPELPGQWDAILQKALAKDPEERYPTAGALARDVKELVSGRWYLRKLSDF
jgi:serine/threonine protein kinase